MAVDSNMVTAVASCVYVAATLVLLVLIRMDRSQRETHFKTTLKSQQETSHLQSFENRYFELIKIHNDNVAEIYLEDIHGRRVFVTLLRELRCLREIIQDLARDCGQTLSEVQIMHVAYYCLFYGAGRDSSRMLKSSLSDSGFDPKFIDAVERKLNDSNTKLKSQSEGNFPYVPFQGHQSRLGHYYRHLYQMVQYVHKQAPVGIDKYDYMKTIRAQLSTHEQALLLINSLTRVGQNWWRHDLITKYRLVKNIPPDFFSKSELDINKLFEPGYFESEDQE